MEESEDPKVIGAVAAYYRLVLPWLRDMACKAAAIEFKNWRKDACRRSFRDEQIFVERTLQPDDVFDLPVGR